MFGRLKNCRFRSYLYIIGLKYHFFEHLSTKCKKQSQLFQVNIVSINHRFFHEQQFARTGPGIDPQKTSCGHIFLDCERERAFLEPQWALRYVHGFAM